MSANANTATKQAIDTTEIKNNFSHNATETVHKLKENAQAKIEQVGEKVGEYKGKVSDNLSNAAGKVHEGADTAQEFLDGKAEKLNDYAHQAIGRANQYGHKAGDALDASSEYVRNFDFAQTAQNLKTGIQQRPGTGIALAGVFGLLVGFLIGRSRN